MSTPVWLLDVDGVLNCSRPGWGEQPHQGRMHANGYEWKFRWAPSLVAFIRSAATAGNADIRWATTWVDHARELEQLFRLPFLPEAFADDPATAFPGLKLTAALHVVEEERRPLVWTDDDAIPQFGPFRDRLETAGVPILLVQPDSRRGLIPDEIAQIRDFLAEHAG